MKAKWSCQQHPIITRINGKTIYTNRGGETFTCELIDDQGEVRVSRTGIILDMRGAGDISGMAATRAERRKIARELEAILAEQIKEGAF